MDKKDLDSLAHDNHVDTMGTYNDWTPIRPSGDIAACKELYKEGRTKLQDLKDDNKRLGFNNQINRREFNRSDGSKITVEVNFGNPLIKIYVPPKKGGKEYHGGYFQCDLFTDHPDFPEDITQQVKTSIAFKVVTTPDWFLIPERQGNMEWIGEDGTLLNFDCVQNWSMANSNRKAWNQGLPCAIHYESAANSNPPGSGPIGYIPEDHPSRNGELTIRMSNVSDVWDISPGTSQNHQSVYAEANHQMFFEPEPIAEEGPHLHKQYFWINGTKYTPVFEFINELIVGGCTHTTKNGVTWCVLVIQPFYVTPPFIGVNGAYEEIKYFKVEPGITSPELIVGEKMWFSVNEGAVYTTSKSHVTPWAFSSDGTKGKACRDHQYFILSSKLNYGYYLDSRFFNMDITYTDLGVTFDFEESTSVTDYAGTVVQDGQIINGGSIEETEWVQKTLDWYAEVMQDFDYPITNIDKDYFSPLVMDWDYIYDDENKTSGKNKFYTLWVLKAEWTNGSNEDATQDIGAQKLFWHNGNLIDYNDYRGIRTNTFNESPSRIDMIDTLLPVEDNNPTAPPVYDASELYYVGGSPRHNIHMFVKVSITSAHRFQRHLDGASDYCYDFAYSVQAQLVCIFKGITKEIGSPVKLDIPSRIDQDIYNMFNVYPGSIFRAGFDGTYVTSGDFMSSVVDFPATGVHGLIDSAIGPLTGNVGRFGGSIKTAEDGSHAVVCCTYLDIAKFLYPWHRYQRDFYNTTILSEKLDTMDSIGVPQELQDAWNKYMINYAIIPHELTEAGLAEADSNNLTSYVGPTGADGPATNTGVLGGGSNQDSLENKGKVDVLQLSNLLFGKIVDDELPTPSDNHDDYEFGIKEKDTTAFLPIGIYGKPEEEDEE